VWGGAELHLFPRTVQAWFSERETTSRCPSALKISLSGASLKSRRKRNRVLSRKVAIELRVNKVGLTVY